jgi:hypothetical protein
MNNKVTLVRGKHCVTLSKQAWDLISLAVTNLVDSGDFADHDSLLDVIDAIDLIESHGFVDPCIPGSQDRQSRTLAH